MHHDSKECWQEDELLHKAFSKMTLLTCIRVSIVIDRSPSMKIKIDTGSEFAIVSEYLEMIVLKLATFQGELVNVKGICLVNVQYGNIHRTVTLIVVNEHCLNLLRLNRFEPLGINISEKLNKYTGKSVTLKLNPNDTPICIKSRKVLYALKEKTDTELDKLIEQRILEPVNHPIWSSLISTLVNPDGRVCI
ncbi:hypothetical protein T07_9916 [Trichinella nelsoni]|uniref:Peptidase A2 domain-containing protein n=1 Tax=Trichinella nelsoni TaxID=6336 RepID=A0A0V0REL6_9BILA|nr:hypothetical protein T07_9916 [Trichinella nelsoni]